MILHFTVSSVALCLSEKLTTNLNYKKGFSGSESRNAEIRSVLIMSILVDNDIVCNVILILM